MNLRQMQQFAVLAETLNFRKAAERLHMAQPPLSVSIKRLEDDLGAPLFVRERRGLRLTTVGEATLTHALQISFHADQLKKAAAGALGGISGPLRVGFIGSATYTLFPRALPAFRERYPKVVLDLREGTTMQILRQTERSEIDLGLIRYPVVEATDAALTPIEHDQLVAALPESIQPARRRALRLQDLANQPFVMYSSASAPNLRGQVIAACQSAGFTPVIVQEAVQVQTLLSLVQSGIGVALVPSVSQAQAREGVVFRALADAADRRLDIAIAVATHGMTVSAAASRFRDILGELSGSSKVGQPAIRPRR